MSFSLRIFESMSFVNPAFLFALSAISIPIIIHLIQLRRYKKIFFSNVAFLHSIEEKQRQSSKLKHLLVLLARILTILFLVLAFAQPYIPVNKQIVNSGKNYVSIYVDNSFSMDRQGANGTLFDEAKRKAKEIVASFKSNDEFQLLGNEFSGNQQRWIGKEGFIKSLEELKIRPESRSLNEVFNRQKSLLNGNKGNSAKAFVISDFQKSFVTNSTKLNNDSSIDWQMVMLENKRNDNIAIDSVWFYSPLHFPNSQENLLVKIHNYSASEISSLAYEVKINGNVLGIGNVKIPAESYVVDTFIFKNKKVNWQEGEVNIKDQSLHFDNSYHFAYNIESSRKVTVIQGANASNYIQSVFQTEPFFTVKSFNYQQIDYKYLSESSIIFINEVDEFSSGLFTELEKSLQNSCVVVSIPSTKENLKINEFNSHFRLSKILPALKINERIDKINHTNDLFENIFFEQDNVRADLPNVLSYYPFEKSSQLPEVLMSLSNGQSVLNKYNYNSGIIYQFAFPLQSSFTDFPKHALIVPTLLRMATIHHRMDAISYTIGLNTNISLPALLIDERVKHELRKGDISIVPEIKSINGLDQIALYDQLSEAGTYILTQENTTLAKIAFNASRAESDLSAISQSDLSSILNSNTKVWNTGDASLSGLIKEEAFGYRLWKICVIFALFFIGIEILLIRFGDRLLNKKT